MRSYTEDALLLPPGEPPMQGAAAIRAHYEAIFSAMTLKLEVAIDESASGGAFVWQRGTVTGTVAAKDGSATQVAHDHFLAIVRRDADGVWRVARLCWGPEEGTAPK